MTPEQVNKSIGQMRSMFWSFGVLTLLAAVLALLSMADDPIFIFGFFLEVLLAVCFWVAFSGLGKRSSTGLMFARICSGLFVLGFPILTIFGISYLIKLWKPEMKQALGGAQSPRECGYDFEKETLEESGYYKDITEKNLPPNFLKAFLAGLVIASIHFTITFLMTPLSKQFPPHLFSVRDHIEVALIAPSPLIASVVYQFAPGFDVSEIGAYMFSSFSYGITGGLLVTNGKRLRRIGIILAGWLIFANCFIIVGLMR